MKNHQDNTSALPALLRAADGVDTLETKSLCCAATGIIAPLSVTAEALTPHEKLRGAALADATLNAQERPLAQPALGGKPSGTWLVLAQKTLFYMFCLLKVLIQQLALIPIMIVKRLPIFELAGNPLSKCRRHLQNADDLKIVGAKLGHWKCIEPIYMSRPSQVPTLYKVSVNTRTSKVFIGLHHNAVQALEHIHLPDRCHKKQLLNPALFLLLLQSVMPNRKRTCSDDGNNRSKSLYPASIVITHNPPILEAPNKQPKTTAQNQKAPNTPDAVSRHKRRNFRHPFSHLLYQPVKSEALAAPSPNRGLSA